MELNPAALEIIRQRTGLSFRQLAQASQRSPSYIRDLESGRRNNPSESTITALAFGLRVPVTAITDGGSDDDES